MKAEAGSYGSGGDPAVLQLNAAARLGKVSDLKIAAHDLAQPIFSLRVHISALRRSLPDSNDVTTEASHLCESLEKCTIALQSTVESLLIQAMSREAAEDAVIASESMTVQELASAASSVLIPVARMSTVDYRTFVGRPNSRICSRIASVALHILINLGGNAIKYKSREKGYSAGVLVAVRELCGNLRLDVIDNGIGMSQEELRRAFEYGWRATTGRPDTMGMGLGMSSVTQCLESLPGHSLDVRSVSGAGTRFSLSIPL